jgi:multiple sugar transport system substrate-binding protein
MLGGDGGNTGSGPAGTLGDWSADWESPESMLDRSTADEWTPPEFDEDEIGGELEQTNAGGMENDPATAYGHDVMRERTGVDITPIEVPSERLAPRTTTILSSRAQSPALLQVPFEFYMDLVQPGYLEPVDEIWTDEMYEAFPASYREDFTTDLDSTLDGDHIYGSHAIAQGVFLHHRTDYLEDMGFPADFLKRPTWSDLREVAEEAQNEDYWGYGWLGQGSREPPRWWAIKVESTGGEILQDDGTVVVNSDEGVAALEWMKQLIDDELVPNPVQYTDAGLNDLFLQGSLLAYETGGNLMRSAEESIGFDSYDMGAPPKADEGPEPQFASRTQTDLICINRFSPPEAKRAAMIYLDANRSAEFDREEWEQEGNMPANPNAIQNIDSPFNETLQFVMDRATDPVWPQQVQTYNTISEELQQVYGDQKSPQQALDDAQEAIDQIMDQ